MTNDLTILDADNRLPAIPSEVGQAANEAAARSAFADYRSRKAANTLTRQDNGLALFADYLTETTGDKHTGEALATNPDAWAGVTWGLVRGFVAWLLLRSYAVGSVNVHLSTVKTYATLTARAGALTTQDLALIRTVQGYSRREGLHADEKREAANIPTRNGHKKREPVALTADQMTALKTQLPDTSQGRRDAVLIGLLCDLGLRCGEVTGLSVSDVDLKRGELTFYREKVDLVQTHRLLNGLQAAMAAYLEQDAPPIGALLRSSRKGGYLTGAGMSARAITARVRYLGKRLLDIPNLSSHDLRHTWATAAARSGTPLTRLQQAGGWTSLAMPALYIQAAAIANEGVRLV